MVFFYGTNKIDKYDLGIIDLLTHRWSFVNFLWRLRYICVVNHIIYDYMIYDIMIYDIM